jgi:hypothetical protein
MKWPVSRRLGGIILALATALALSACSAVKLGYTNLPHLAQWWLDGYLDLDEPQEAQLHDALAALQDWHRQEELPRLAAVLARLEQLAPGEITPQQACTVVADVQARLKAVAYQAEPAAVALAATLTPRQFQHRARTFRSNTERFRREWIALTPAEQLEKRIEQMQDRLESVYGRLDAPQRAVLKQRMATTVWDPNRMLAQWQRRQQELVDILGRLRAPGLPPAEAAALLRGWVDRLQQPANAEYGAYQEALLQEGCSTFAAVHHATTAAQREHAARRLRAWQRDLRELAGPAS